MDSTYVSHYSRAETEARFLPYDFTENKMYQLYLEENYPKVGFQFYKIIFYKYFNLERRPPIKDTCNKCDMFSAQIQVFVPVKWQTTVTKKKTVGRTSH